MLQLLFQLRADTQNINFIQNIFSSCHYNGYYSSLVENEFICYSNTLLLKYTSYLDIYLIVVIPNFFPVLLCISSNNNNNKGHQCPPSFGSLFSLSVPMLGLPTQLSGWVSSLFHWHHWHSSVREHPLSAELLLVAIQGLPGLDDYNISKVDGGAGGCMTVPFGSRCRH